MANRRPHGRSSDRYCQGSDLAERGCRQDALQRHLLPDLPRCGGSVEDDAELRAQRPAGTGQGCGPRSLAHLRAAAERGRIRTGCVKPQRPGGGVDPPPGSYLLRCPASRLPGPGCGHVKTAGRIPFYRSRRSYPTAPAGVATQPAPTRRRQFLMKKEKSP